MPVVQYKKVQCGPLQYSIPPPPQIFVSSLELQLDLFKIFLRKMLIFLIVKKINVLNDAFSSPCKSFKIYVDEAIEIADDIEVIAESDITRKLSWLTFQVKELLYLYVKIYSIMTKTRR